MRRIDHDWRWFAQENQTAGAAVQNYWTVFRSANLPACRQVAIKVMPRPRLAIWSAATSPDEIGATSPLSLARVQDADAQARAKAARASLRDAAALHMALNRARLPIHLRSAHRPKDRFALLGEWHSGGSAQGQNAIF